MSYAPVSEKVNYTITYSSEYPTMRSDSIKAGLIIITILQRKT